MLVLMLPPTVNHFRLLPVLWVVRLSVQSATGLTRSHAIGMQYVLMLHPITHQGVLQLLKPELSGTVLLLSVPMSWLPSVYSP